MNTDSTVKTGYFSSRLQKLRKEKGLRQRDLAQKLGISQSAVANYEQGTRFPDEQTLIRISRIFGSSLDYMLGTENRLYTSSQLTVPSFKKIEDLRNSYAEMLFTDQGEEAARFLSKHVGVKYSFKELLLEVVSPALFETGARWERGEIDAAMEHVITSYAERTIDLLSFFVPKAVQKNRTFIGLSVSGEMHTLGLKMIYYLLKLDGWDSWFLGSNVPSAEVISLCKSRNANILGISATMPYHTDGVRTLIRSIRNDSKLTQLKILVGGQAFHNDPGLWVKIGADGYAEDASKAIKTANKLVTKN